MYAVLCALEGRPSSEEELQKIRQGMATRVESRQLSGTMEECLPREEVLWQKFIQRTSQGRRMGGPPEVEAWAAEGDTKWRCSERQKAEKGTGKWWNMGTECHWMQEFCGPGVESTRFSGGSGVPGVTRMRWRRRCKEYWTVHKTGRSGPKKCWTGRGDRSYQGMGNAYIGHSAPWT